MHCFSGHDLLVQSGAGQQPKAPEPEQPPRQKARTVSGLAF